MRNYEKDFIILSDNFYFITIFAQEVIDLGGIESIKIESVKKDEQFISAKIGTKEGFQLILSAKKTNGEERILAKIAHFSAYEKLCEDGKYYFFHR